MISVASSLVASSEAEINAETNGIDVTITATGAGFIPGEAVTVTIVSLADGADKILVGGAANDSGAFSLSATLAGPTPTGGSDPAMPIAPGVYTVLAEGANGSGATGAPRDSLQVVAGLSREARSAGPFGTARQAQNGARLSAKSCGVK